MRKSESSKRNIHKDIVNHEDLEYHVMRLLKQLFTRKVYIETDIRAHRNPARMQNIAKATEDLIKNIKSLCPKCGVPGFIVTGVKRGISCALCSRPTDNPTSLMYKCFKCEYPQDLALHDSTLTADLATCEYCNS